MKKVTLILLLTLSFLTGNAQNPCDWLVNPTGSVNVCEYQTVTRNAVFKQAGGTFYWIDDITKDTVSTGMNLNYKPNQSRIVHCTYVLAIGFGCDGTYVSDLQINVSVCHITPVEDPTPENQQDIQWNGSAFITSGKSGNISLSNMQGVLLKNISCQPSETSYSVDNMVPGIYIVNISYDGRQSTTKIYIQ